MINTFFHKKFLGSCIDNEIKQNELPLYLVMQQLTGELLNNY